MATPGAASDQPAFEARVRRDARGLYGLALAVLRDTQEAEDAVQDTMELAWRSWRSVHDEERRTAWLRQIPIDATHAIAVLNPSGTQNALIETSDGGRTWKPIEP